LKLRRGDVEELDELGTKLNRMLLEC